LTIALIRIDDRLIHGQVVVGWGSHIRPVGYLVVDDRLAGNELEGDLYRMGLPPGIEARFAPEAGIASVFATLDQTEGPWVVLVPDVATTYRIAQEGALLDREVNLGGVHSADGIKTTVPYIRLDKRDRAALEGLAELGIVTTARALPDSPPVPLSAFIA